MSVKCFDSCMTETGVREELDKYSFASSFFYAVYAFLELYRGQNVRCLC